MLNKEMDGLAQQCIAMAKQLAAMQDRLERARKAWPYYQVRVGAEWHDRAKTPPDGYVWASDGLGRPRSMAYSRPGQADRTECHGSYVLDRRLYPGAARP